MNYWPRNYWPTSVSLAVPTLTLADNGDGTGAVATIADATDGTANTVYYQAFVGQVGSGEWSNGGERSGNGDVSLPLATGHYLAYVASALGGEIVGSAVSYFVVTSSDDAVHYQCLEAAQTRIRSLALASIDSDNVVVKKLPLERIVRANDLSLPAIFITPTRETMNPRSGVNTHDDVGYGVLVTIIDSDNQEATLAANLNKYQLWREKIAKAFRNQRLSGVSSVITAWVEPADVVIPAAWQANLFATALLIRFISRQTRGI